MRDQFFRVFTTAIFCISMALAQAPANDSCATAQVIGNGLFPGTNVGATTGPDPTGSCGFMGADVWYAYLAPCTGTAVATFCPPGSAIHDTVLAAWSGACGGLTELVCNDDSCASLQSTVSFPVTAGSLYYISAGGYSGQTGSFVLSMSCLAPVANDTCATATSITTGVPIPGTNFGASTGGDPVVTSCGFNNSFDLWYSFTALCNGSHTATTCDASTNFDTVIGIWSGGCGSLSPVACNDDDPTGCPPGAAFGLESRVSWTATAGTTYHISVAGYGGNQGNFAVSVSVSGGVSLSFISAGVGTLGYQVVGGPSVGSAFTALTLTQGTYPNDWFFGIGITLPELSSQLSTGFPFIVGLDLCGAVTLGPVPGLPTGLTVYGVSLAIPPGFPVPTAVSSPATGTVP